MRSSFFVFVLNIFRLSYGIEDGEGTKNLIIACHSTDFECFKRQYDALRRGVLLGNPELGIEDYNPYYLRYGTSKTCIRISGFEQSVLKGISINDGGRYFKLIIEMPLILQQLMFQNMLPCALPKQPFSVMPTHAGPLKRYDGNATIQVTYPFFLKKKKGKMFLILGEEGVDVILDILDLSSLKDGNEEEKKRYQLSEWAYDVVQHINVAESFALPFTGQIREFGAKIPLDRYLLLYPEEEYSNVYFKYSESPYFDNKDQKAVNPLYEHNKINNIRVKRLRGLLRK